MEEGFTFEAVADGRPFVVKVPPGGVKEGQVFSVPYPFASEQPADSLSAVETDDPLLGAPTGRWRNPLFSCCNVVGKTQFWVAFCCPAVTTAQLLTRMNLNYLGNEDGPEAVRGTVLGVFLLTGAFVMFMLNSPYEAPARMAYAFAFFYLVYVMSRVRFAMRKTYGIGGQKCCNKVGDFCMMLWCGCCANIQMTRHTHDENEYMYSPTAPNGLYSNAPTLPNKVVSPAVAPRTVLSENQVDSKSNDNNIEIV